MSIFDPVQDLADWLAYSVFSLQKGSRIADSVNFFIFDSLKIILLLIAINYVMAIVRHYLPVEKIRDFLAKRKWYGLDYFLAACFGAVTPFCSCSSIPLFTGFLSAGIPIGVTFAFLITSPLINEAALVLFAGLFGWKITLLYAGAGILLGIIGGLVLSRVNVKRHVSSDIVKLIYKPKVAMSMAAAEKISSRLWRQWWSEGLTLTKKLILYVLIGVGVGAAIHGYVPQGFFEYSLRGGAWWTVPLATIVAVPLYSNAAAVLPVASALVAAGVPLGTAMAFMLATVGLSLPEALILKKVMSWKLLATFFAVVTAGIVCIGYLFNVFHVAI
jgi:uncharacterized membrane protein YraQ (UPF0718 family)